MIEVVLKGAVLCIALQREAVRNALDLATTEALLEALERVAGDLSVGAIVLHGRGAGFCAGSDVKEMATASLERRLQIAERKALLMRRLATLDRPVVCAVHGFALGGGFMLAIGCDVVVSAEDAQWRLPEVGLGFFPPWGIEALLRRVGIARARWLVWGAEAVSGIDALRLGLAEEAVAAGNVVSRAMEIATRLAAMPAESVRATKQFFSVHPPAPGLDVLAREVYRANCDAGAADATFKRFGG
jgi:enoyl-CoA hydratase/carnithine racemase